MSSSEPIPVSGNIEVDSPVVTSIETDVKDYSGLSILLSALTLKIDDYKLSVKNLDDRLAAAELKLSTVVTDQAAVYREATDKLATELKEQSRINIDLINKVNKLYLSRRTVLGFSIITLLLVIGGVIITVYY